MAGPSPTGLGRLRGAGVVDKVSRRIGVPVMVYRVPVQARRRTGGVR
jgi:hypothetical protein